jgi:cobalt-precorrin-7 (C5)-methyltransferase
MASVNQPIVIAGCGPGARALVTAEVETAVRGALLLAGAPRLLELFADARAERMPLIGPVEPWLTRLDREITDHPNTNAVVLVTGDPGLCSIAACVLNRFGRARCRLLPGISSVQLACARLGLAWYEAQIVSMHAGLPTRPTNERVPWIFLMGANGGESRVAAWAHETNRRCFVCEDLSLSNERVEAISSERLAALPSHPRRIVVLTRESSDDE